MGGLSLPTLAASRAAQRRSSHKSVIMVYLSGGLSHHDSFDLKPDAPAEIARRVSAHRHARARHPHRRTPAAARRHDGQAGRRALHRRPARRALQLPDADRLRPWTWRSAKASRTSARWSPRSSGRPAPIVPGFVDLFPTMQHRPYNIPGPGYRRARRSPAPRSEGDHAQADAAAATLVADQFQDRRQLLRTMDDLRRDLDNAADRTHGHLVSPGVRGADVAAGSSTRSI